DHWRPDLRSSHLARALTQIDDCTSEVGIVCLGTSRFYLAFKAPLAQDQVCQTMGDRSVAVFNGSIPSADFDTSDYLLEQMLARGWRPSLVVLEMSPELVNQRNPLFGSHVLPRLNATTLPQYAADLWRSNNVKLLVKHRLLPVVSCRRSLRGECARVL